MATDYDDDVVLSGDDDLLAAISGEITAMPGYVVCFWCRTQSVGEQHTHPSTVVHELW